MTIAYKVVRADKGDLLSCTVRAGWELKYKLGEWTEAKGGPIFCFSSLEKAMNFVGYYEPGLYPIYRCKVMDKVEPHDSVHRMIFPSTGIIYEEYELFWKYEHDKKQAPEYLYLDEA